jgi:O-antigen ligase
MMANYTRIKANTFVIILIILISTILPTLVFRYITTSILSVLFSNNKFISLYGFVEHKEGVLILFSYIYIFVISISNSYSNTQLKIVIGAIVLGAIVISLIGIPQYFGYDLFKTSFGGRLIYPSQYHDLADSRVFESIKYSIYTTFGNSNYVGSYMAMIFPISLGLYFFQSKPKNIALYGFLSLAFYMMWIGCKSRAGILGGIIAIIVFFLFYRKRLIGNIKKMWILLPFVIIFLFMNWFSSGGLISKISTLNPSAEKAIYDQRNIDLEDIEIKENTAKLIGKNYILNLSFDQNQVIFTDNIGSILQLETKEDGAMKFIDEGYTNFSVKYKIFPSKTLLELRINNRPLNWYYENGKLSIIGKLGTFYTELNKPESFGFEGRERFASSRGYIWSRSIPLLKDALLIGYGPDTFAAIFPQDDLIGKIKYLSRADILVDKPHNFYLQTFLNTGGLSLLSLLVIFSIYIWTGFKLFWKSGFNEYHKQIGVLILVAIIGYLVAAFFNDSVVSVAPVFWTLLGVGYSINDRVVKEKVKIAIEISDL